MSDQLGWKDIPIVVAFKTSLEYKTGSWRVFKPAIDYKLCTRCYLCEIYCPDDAVKIDSDGAVIIDYDYCKGCGICAKECPVKAIKMVVEE